jgi:hypothetical protein
MTVLGLRATLLEIVDDRFCNNSRQRIDRGVSCLAGKDLKSLALPVDIVQSESCNLMRP